MEKEMEKETEGSFFGLAFSTFLCCTLVIVLNSSFFMSNEKNRSLFTILLSHTKDLVTSVLSYFFLPGNDFTVKIVAGLLISTTGGVIFSSKSICDNLIFGDGKIKELDIAVPDFPKSQVIEIKNATSSEIVEESNEINGNSD